MERGEHGSMPVCKGGKCSSGHPPARVEERWSQGRREHGGGTRKRSCCVRKQGRRTTINGRAMIQAGSVLGNMSWRSAYSAEQGLCQERYQGENGLRKRRELAQS